MIIKRLRKAAKGPRRATLLDFSFLNVSLSAIYCGHHYVVNEILSHVLLLEGHKAEASRLSSVNVL
jgi:hypothetical protein